MEALTRLLEEAVDAGLIRLHPMCQEPRITHLLFADDLLIFSDGSRHSLTGIKKVLSDFKALTGLDMNAAKSEIFFGGYTEIQSSVLSDIAGVKLGTFPTRYLGLPLNPSRVSYATLQPFLERITSKMHSWTVKNLSFAGKVRMVASVIYGMVNFWSSVFALPKRFYEKVDSLCCAFLWKNRTSSAAGTRVSWSDICKPKKEGGLGLRRLEEFQQVFNLKRVWNFFSGSGSLWVAWLHSNVFSRRCYWTTADSQRLSPTVRSMIRIKETVAEFLRCSIRDGRAASFWYDYWTHMGPLIEGFGQRGPRELRITLESVVADATVNGEWQLPPARSNVAETLQIGNLSGITKRCGPPASWDWNAVEKLTWFLVIFYNSTWVVSASSKVIAFKCYGEIVTIERNLTGLASSLDSELKLKASEMLKKFLKYWDGIMGVNKMLILATIFDRTKKMHFAKLCFEKLCGKDSLEAKEMAKSVTELLTSMFKEYIM
ncbi:PREDICTED: uncharacterized protein LOC106297625 [Brassica oleracea var. oleracea]|uniref:uncharacterized protein LOC106297625 n=1 Tax=Brassica oleracea var. oleracea TaxID=109376 RepID=UPI0006A6D7DE|nr:PREDICTED: uncharacterized protein LOC106297625 [Brassica oleracea var. oleracea]